MHRRRHTPQSSRKVRVHGKSHTADHHIDHALHLSGTEHCLMLASSNLGHMLWSIVSICWEAGHCGCWVTMLTNVCNICALLGGMVSHLRRCPFFH